jgi:hypothetical protein
MRFFPDSAGRSEPSNAAPRTRPVHEKKGPEIHSAKAHRCVDKVMAKGHPESSAWAICTSSIGAEGVYAKGHGGSARPKRKIREMDPLDVEAEAIFEGAGREGGEGGAASDD